MKLKKKLDDNSEFNFWQPASDMFSALLLVFMLVILLLGLYLVHIPEHDEVDPEYGDGVDSGEVNFTPMLDWNSGGEGETPIPTLEVTPSPTPTPTPTPTPIIGAPGAGGGGSGGGNGQDDPGEGLKSAVYVMLVDGDTERTIKEPNIQFELYGLDGALQILNTYYPERISFRIYETTESGTFFFPEKLLQGEYELHDLTTPEGYDPAPNVQFSVDEEFDWPDPLVVKVPIYPSRNVIRIRLTDFETGRPVTGSTFDVISVNDVITLDGTLRYRAGQVVSEIVLDEEGEGESEEIYLGSYLVRQRTVPEYYASLDTDVEAEVTQKGNRAVQSETVTTERTKISVRLTDELTPSRGIGGATFSLTANGVPVTDQELVTNGSGELLLDSLDKGVTYSITQLTSGNNYRIDPNSYSFTVDTNGRIDGLPLASLELVNHVVRVNIGIVDEFSRTPIANVNLSLFTSDGDLLHSWMTTGDSLSFNNLEPGFYYIVRENDSDSRYDFQVLDVAEVQEVTLTGTHLLRYIIIGGTAALMILIVVVVIIIIRRRRRRDRTE